MRSSLRLLLCLVLVLFPLVACGGPVRAHVASVIDGDTIVVRMPNTRPETVRLIGIDAPETVHPKKPVGCYGPEASAHLKELLTGKDIILERKPDEDRDKYHRLLRYVRFQGVDLDAQLIREGYAKNYAVFPHPRSKQYKALQQEAKREKKGLWGKCASFARS